VRLRFIEPAWNRTCKMCQKFAYGTEPDQPYYGQIIPNRRSLPVTDTPRQNGTRLPCWKCPKVPKDAIERSSHYADEVTQRTWRVLQHFLECKITGDWPRRNGQVDAIVRKNAALIEEILREAERRDRQKDIIELLTIAKLGNSTRNE